MMEGRSDDGGRRETQGNSVPGQETNIFGLFSHLCREILIHLFLRNRKGNCSSVTRQERLEEPGSLRMGINYCFLFLPWV